MGLNQLLYQDTDECGGRERPCGGQYHSSSCDHHLLTQGRWIELRDTEQGKVMVDLSWLPVTGDREVIR